MCALLISSTGLLPFLLCQAQGRTADALFQIEKGLDEARAVGEAVIYRRLRRLKAQVRALLSLSYRGRGGVETQKSQPQPSMVG